MKVPNITQLQFFDTKKTAFSVKLQKFMVHGEA